MGNLTNRKRKRMAKKAGEASGEMVQELLQSRIGMSKKEVKPTEIRTRTRTRVRAGGDVVKTKTVSKGGGMKRVEKTKTSKNPFGSSTLRSVYEGGPKGKSKSSSYMYKSKDGGSYGFNIEKTKKGGIKNVRGSEVDSYKMPASTFYTSRSGKVNIPAYSSMDKTSMSKTKSKGMKSKVKKTTYGEGYDVYGKYVPEKTMVKSKKSK